MAVRRTGAHIDHTPYRFGIIIGEQPHAGFGYSYVTHGGRLLLPGACEYRLCLDRRAGSCERENNQENDHE